MAIGVQGKKNMKNCSICHIGELRPGTATVVLERAATTVVMKQVPALVCDNCAEHYLDEANTRRTYQIAEEAVARGAEVEIVRFAA